MTGFTKLVPEIVNSSIWNESPEVRCVWIAMIATKDQHGNIRGNRLSLARMANVSLEAVDEALSKFLAPDPDSNNQEQEGRRIALIPGGWHVISHDAYRAKDYREWEAERKKSYREKRKTGICPGHVPDSSVSVSVSASAPKGGCKGGRFQKPTAEQVTAYGKSIKFDIDGENFVDFYSSKGWKVGKTPMTDWKAAVRTWKKTREKEKGAVSQSSKDSDRAARLLQSERNLQEALS